MTHDNLLASAAPNTLLPVDPAAALLADVDDLDAVREAIKQHPTSSLGWSVLARAALDAASLEGDLAAYAYARTGYHRGLDALRRSGWKGAGPVPWEHEPNRGFLTALWALSVAAGRIGEVDEADRCSQFLRDSSPAAATALAG
jgi:hypothetical protein